MPTSFRTYEAQSRLLAAVLAAHPELKLNYRAIAEHYSSESTFSSIEHRFRPIKEQSKALRAAVANGVDPRDVNIQDKKEIARVFGGSTPDGIQFQFRGVKKEAQNLLDAANNGQASADALPRTPTKKASTKGRPTGSGRTNRSTLANPPSSASTSNKRKTKARKCQEVDSKESDDAELDFDAMDESPIHKKVRVQPNKMTSAEFDQKVQAFEASRAASSPSAHNAITIQEVTPSETDNSGQTSPVLKLETDFGGTIHTTGPMAVLGRSTVVQQPSLFGSGPSASSSPQSIHPESTFGQFSTGQPGSFAFSFGGNEGGSNQGHHPATGFGGSNVSFGYSQESFTDGEV